MKSGIGPACVGLLLFLAVGVGLTAKPLDRSCPDGGTWVNEKCYYIDNYVYDYETSYEYYETVPEPADSK